MNLPMIKKSADLGYIPAQLLWAEFYTGGDHNNPDQPHNETTDRLVFDWYQAAAEKGNLTAQNMLSYYYKDGVYVAKDRAEGLKWQLLSNYIYGHHDVTWPGLSPPLTDDEKI